jgi:hypothetical protein
MNVFAPMQKNARANLIEYQVARARGVFRNHQKMEGIQASIPAI